MLVEGRNRLEGEAEEIAANADLGAVFLGRRGAGGPSGAEG